MHAHINMRRDIDVYIHKVWAREIDGNTVSNSRFSFQSLYIFIYIYIERERDREKETETEREKERERERED